MDNKKLVFLSVLTLLQTDVLALDIKGALEQPCFKIPKTVQMDLKWVESVDKWYYPMMSRLDLYVTAVDLLRKDPKDISETDLYYNACVAWKMVPGNSSYVTEGFHDHQVVYHAKVIGEGSDTYEFWTDSGTAGTCYTTLTDNKSFTFSAGCLKGNQMVWGVTSPYKTLPPETVELIHEHAESLGFKREYFTALRYDSCDMAKK